MSNEAIAWARFQEAGTPAAKLLLLLLADRADKRHSCYPGQELLARESEQSVRSVRRHLDVLEGRGLIRRERRFGSGGYRTSDRFVLPVTLTTGQSVREEIGQSGRQEILTGQVERPTGQTRQSYRTPVSEEPSVEPSVQEPSDGSASRPTTRWLDANHEQREQFANLVSEHGDPESIWTFLHDEQCAINPLAWANALEAKGQLRGYLASHYCEAIEVRTDPAIGPDRPVLAGVGGLQW